ASPQPSHGHLVAYPGIAARIRTFRSQDPKFCRVGIPIAVGSHHFTKRSKKHKMGLCSLFISCKSPQEPIVKKSSTPASWEGLS
ncbi:MAG: hypothetical protein SCH98_12645, partial [Deferrisomatales bacterium]|nr:hypothetical protein [Deferrisomatales bacterium]